MTIDSSEACPSPEPKVANRRWRFIVWFALGGLFAIGWQGSRKVPADPTKPIVLREGSNSAVIDDGVLCVATFNIHSGKGKSGVVDLKKTADALRGRLDLACLNEVRGTFSPQWKPDQAAELGTLLDMNSAFIPTESQWWHDHFGNALLTRLPVRHIHRIPLPTTQSKAFRNLFLAQFEWHGKEIQLVSVHIDSQSDREQQLRIVISLFLGLTPPAILMGDFNSASGEPQLQELLARPDVTDALPSVKHPHIDWIFARGVRCRKGDLIVTEASDHPVAIAEFELAPNP